MFSSVLFLSFILTFVKGKPAISYDELIHVRNSLNTLSDELLAFEDSITGRNGQQPDKKLKNSVSANNFDKFNTLHNDLTDLKDVLVKAVIEKSSPDQVHEHFKATNNEDFLTLGRNNQKFPIHQKNDAHVAVEKVGEPLQRDANGKVVKDASSKNVAVEKVGEPLQRDANGKLIKDASSRNVVVEKVGEPLLRNSNGKVIKKESGKKDAMVVVKVGEPLQRDANGKLINDASSRNVVVEKVGEPLLRNSNGKVIKDESGKNVVVEKVGEPLQRDASGNIVKDASSKNVVVEKVGKPLQRDANGNIVKETDGKNDKSADLEQTLSKLKDALVMLKDSLVKATKSGLVKKKYPLNNIEEQKDVSLLSQLDDIKGEVQSIDDLKTLDKAVDEQVRKSDEETAALSKKEILMKKFQELDQLMAEVKDIMLKKKTNH